MIKVSLFTLFAFMTIYLQAMEQPYSQSHPLSLKSPLLLDAHELSGKLKNLIKKFVPDNFSGFDSSTKDTIKILHKDTAKTLDIFETSTDNLKNYVKIFKGACDNKSIYHFNMPYFENPDTIQKEIFDDNWEVNDSLRHFVWLMHEFQQHTNSIPENTCLKDFNIFCKKNTADLAPSITGKFILPSPSASPKTSPLSSPVISPASSPSIQPKARTFSGKQLMVKELLNEKKDDKKKRVSSLSKLAHMLKKP